MPYKDKDKKRNHNRTWQNEQRKKRVEAGLCARCGNLVTNGRNCDHCANKINKETAKRYRQVREDVISAYGGKCKCCGEASIEFLAIDHINGNGKSDRNEKGKSGFYRWIKNNNYPSDYQVLCHNCNWAKFAYGICPHKRVLK